MNTGHKTGIYPGGGGHLTIQSLCWECRAQEECTLGKMQFHEKPSPGTQDIIKGGNIQIEEI